MYTLQHDLDDPNLASRGAVTHSVPPYHVVGGVPARFVRPSLSVFEKPFQFSGSILPMPSPL